MTGLLNQIKRTVSWFGVSLWVSSALIIVQPLCSADDTKTVSILHTNDLHSHYRPDKGPLNLGGVARLKTKLDELRKSLPSSVLVDGGDFSEGNIYYVLGTGTASIQMMDHLGYDVTVIGNHDWLNGPDVLIDSLAAANAKTRFVSANFSTENYARKADFEKWIPPYVIQEVALGGDQKIKIAFIGISTYEQIYDKFIQPVTILDPKVVIPPLAERLKAQAEIVIGISHNNIDVNEAILKAAPQLDLIVGAHDHVKLTEPVIVPRSFGKDGWVVETGSWGQFLGQVDIQITPDKQVKLSGYKLHQIDGRIPEDRETKSKVKSLEAQIIKQFGTDIFHDHIADCEFEVGRNSYETVIGNLVTDAFLNATKADIALDSTKFIYGELHKGKINTVDVFNTYPGIYSAETHKTWTLKTLPMTGRLLKWLLYFMYATNKVSTAGILSASGIQFVYDPLFAQRMPDGDPDLPEPFSESRFSLFNALAEGPRAQEDPQSLPVVQNILIQGKPLNTSSVYKIAASEGMVEALRFINANVLNIVPLDQLVDTGQEQWRILGNYVTSISPLTPEKVSVGTRIRTLQADLGFLESDINWTPIQRTPVGMAATVTAKVRNMGMRTSNAEVKLHLYQNKNGIDLSCSPQLVDLSPVLEIPPMVADEVKELSWTVLIPEHYGYYPITLALEGMDHELMIENNEVTKWFKP